MFCNNCGKSNARGILKCAYCGTEMPKITESAGFSDILSFKAVGRTDVVTSHEPKNADIKPRKESDADMKKIKNNNLGLIAIIISALILVYSVYTNMKTTEKIDKFQKDINKKIELINGNIPQTEENPKIVK